MVHLYCLGHLLLIGAQISGMVRQIKAEMTMHIQIMYTYKHADAHKYNQGGVYYEFLI